jgi:hypothetical protein
MKFQRQTLKQLILSAMLGTCMWKEAMAYLKGLVVRAMTQQPHALKMQALNRWIPSKKPSPALQTRVSPIRRLELSTRKQQILRQLVMWGSPGAATEGMTWWYTIPNILRTKRPEWDLFTRKDKLLMAQ